MYHELHPLKIATFAPLGLYKNMSALSKAMSHSPKPDSVRYCVNIKSKKHPDVRCPNRATQGDYCGLHNKHPTRFVPKTPPLVPLKSIQYSARVIQKAWRHHTPLLRYKHQGPAANDPTLSTCDSDIYTFDPITQVPMVYRWSYADSHKNIWLFDIRSLWMMYEKANADEFLNPYTREGVPKSAQDSFRRRCSVLRTHKYILTHASNHELTSDQLWQQRILDIILRLDNLGYHTCVSWFEELSLPKLYDLYSIIFQIWSTPRLTPTQVKKEIIPNLENQEKPVLQKPASFYKNHTEKRWWQKHVLDTIEALITSSQKKGAQTQGAILVIRAYAFVSLEVRRSYHWLLS